MTASSGANLPRITCSNRLRMDSEFKGGSRFRNRGLDYHPMREQVPPDGPVAQGWGQSFLLSAFGFFAEFFVADSFLGSDFASDPPSREAPAPPDFLA